MTKKIDLSAFDEDVESGLDLSDFDSDTVDSPTQEIGALQSALMGAGSSASLGFDDEIAAALNSPIGALKAAGNYLGVGTSSDSDTGDYEQAKKQYQDLKEVASAQNPVAYGSGYIGGMLAPGLGLGGTVAKGVGLGAKVARGALAGAATGAIEGAGGGEELSDIAEGALGGAVVGGALGSIPALEKQARKLGILEKAKNIFDQGKKGVELFTDETKNRLAKESLGLSDEFIGSFNQALRSTGESIKNIVKKYNTPTDKSAAFDDLASRVRSASNEPLKQDALEEVGVLSNFLSSKVDSLRESTPEKLQLLRQEIFDLDFKTPKAKKLASDTYKEITNQIKSDIKNSKDLELFNKASEEYSDLKGFQETLFPNITSTFKSDVSKTKEQISKLLDAPLSESNITQRKRTILDDLLNTPAMKEAKSIVDKSSDYIQQQKASKGFSGPVGEVSSKLIYGAGKIVGKITPQTSKARADIARSMGDVGQATAPLIEKLGDKDPKAVTQALFTINQSPAMKELVRSLVPELGEEDGE